MRMETGSYCTLFQIGTVQYSTRVYCTCKRRINGDFFFKPESIEYSIIYLSRILCLCVCVCVTICVRTLCYSFSFINQTDQGDETEGFKREGLKGER
jgi:hypothetical protein